MRISDWSSDVCSSDLVILSAIEEEVDITLVELAEMLRSEHGAVFAPSTIWRFLDRHSMTIKKNQRTPAKIGRAADRARVCQTVIVPAGTVTRKTQQPTITTITNLKQYITTLYY